MKLSASRKKLRIYFISLQIQSIDIISSILSMTISIVFALSVQLDDISTF